MCGKKGNCAANVKRGVLSTRLHEKKRGGWKKLEPNWLGVKRTTPLPTKDKLSTHDLGEGRRRRIRRKNGRNERGNGNAHFGLQPKRKENKGGEPSSEGKKTWPDRANKRINSPR